MDIEILKWEGSTILRAVGWRWQIGQGQVHIFFLDKSPKCQVPGSARNILHMGSVTPTSSRVADKEGLPYEEAPQRIL